MYLPFTAEHNWVITKDGNSSGREIYHRHYSYKPYKDGREPKLFVGPGEKLVLISQRCDALFVWRKCISDNGQTGINCAVFRNESSILSSDLILEAEQIALERWQKEKRLYTYINTSKIKSSNPGYCFKVAGWKRCGITKWNKLLIFEKVFS
jgi:hypothetical protein